MTRLCSAIAVCMLVGEACGAQVAELDGLIEDIGDAEIVILGEIHDNPVHHERQALIVEALQPGAIVFEMIPQKLEDRVNDLRAEGADRAKIARALDWDRSGWPDWEFYARILESAPEARIFGAGQPSDDIRKAAREGAAKAFGPHGSAYGLDVELPDDEQKARENLMAVSHCNALPDSALPGMVEVQRFRDAGLADAALWARTSTGEDGRVVVITGNGHADLELGMPAMIMLADPDVSVFSLGQGETPGSPSDAFDAWISAPPPDREDPCAALLENKK